MVGGALPGLWDTKQGLGEVARVSETYQGPPTWWAPGWGGVDMLEAEVTPDSFSLSLISKVPDHREAWASLTSIMETCQAAGDQTIPSQKTQCVSFILHQKHCILLPITQLYHIILRARPVPGLLGHVTTSVHDSSGRYQRA